MGLVFDQAKALKIVATHLDIGAKTVASNIKDEAQRRAPIRKTRKYDRKSNRKVSGGGRGKPLVLGYFQQGADRPIPDNVIANLVRSAQAQRVEASRRAILLKQPEKKQAKLTTHDEFMAVIASEKLELRPLDDTNVPGAVLNEIRHGKGVRFSAKTGRAVLGGTLRKSIKVDPKMSSGLVIKYEVRAHANYAKWVEEGTSHNSKAQPFMRPAIKIRGTVEALRNASRW